MNALELLEKQRNEIVQLNAFRSHIRILKVNVGLSDETISELEHKIGLRITQCEISIRNLLTMLDNC